MGHRVGVRSLDGRDLCGIYHQFRTVRTEFQFVFSCTETIEFMVKFKRFIEDIAYVAGTFGSEMHVVRSGQISVHPLHHGSASAHGGIKVPIGYAAFFRHGFHGFYQTGQDGVSLHFAVYGSGHVRWADEKETSVGGQFPEIFNLSFQAGHVIVDPFFPFQVRNGISAILQDDEPDVFASEERGQRG